MGSNSCWSKPDVNAQLEAPQQPAASFDHLINALIDAFYQQRQADTSVLWRNTGCTYFTDIVHSDWTSLAPRCVIILCG